MKTTTIFILAIISIIVVTAIVVKANINSRVEFMLSCNPTNLYIMDGRGIRRQVFNCAGENIER